MHIQQDSQQKKYGVIRSWNEARGFGIVRVGPPSSLEKYFLHVSKIIAGTGCPVAGMEVHFLVSPKAPEEGRLRAAIDAEIIVQSVPVNDGNGDGGAL